MNRIKKLASAAILVGLGIMAGVWLNSPAVQGQGELRPVKSAVRAAAPAEDGKLRIICFGAHPDDCELKGGGVAALWAEQGHHVKFVSVTNGDIGHWRQAGGPLARRRLDEVQRAARILGISTEVLDIHDGELLPTVENRRKITRLIREWKADLVISHRPNDYHPDHRYTGVLVQDAAYMVTVPFFCPDVPHLKDNPVFMYFPDQFKKPNPFQPDVIVGIDSVIEKKLAAVDVMESQFFEGGVAGGPELLENRERRLREVRTRFTLYFGSAAVGHRKELVEWHGEEQAKKIRFAEAFEVCEYGKQPTKAQLARLFPFHD